MNIGISKVSNIILYKRYEIISKIRKFFLKKNILEVETPLLTQYTITDVNIYPFKVYNKINNIMWLITSPEYHMKRLLSNGIGPIYQICHSFRRKEYGKLHNPEFTLLEWYQPFYNMFDMIELIESFLIMILNINTVDKISYQEVFMKYFSINPVCTSIKILNNILIQLNHKHLIHVNNSINNLLDLIFMIGIQPNIGHKQPIFIYHYPADQAMLARINKKNTHFSDRFEIFFKGLELGNGFCELINYKEQMQRFKQDNILRKQYHLSTRSIDIRLIDALNTKYMPYCSGIAIGLDRLIMLMLNQNSIDNVLSFYFANC